LPVGDLSGKRILFCLAPPGRKASADVAAAFSASLKTLEALGAELEEMPGDGLTSSRSGARSITPSGEPDLKNFAAEHRDELSDTFLKQLALAQRISGVVLPAGHVRPHHPVPYVCSVGLVWCAGV